MWAFLGGGELRPVTVSCPVAIICPLTFNGSILPGSGGPRPGRQIEKSGLSLLMPGLSDLRWPAKVGSQPMSHPAERATRNTAGFDPDQSSHSSIHRPTHHLPLNLHPPTSLPHLPPYTQPTARWGHSQATQLSEQDRTRPASIRISLQIRLSSNPSPAPFPLPLNPTSPPAPYPPTPLSHRPLHTADS